MARRITIDCDICPPEDRQPGIVIDIALRTHTLEDAYLDSELTVSGTLEICADHASPARILAELIREHGVPLSEEATHLLTHPPRKGETEYVLCFNCTPPKRLRPGSLYSHAQSLHNCTQSQLDIRPADD